MLRLMLFFGLVAAVALALASTMVFLRSVSDAVPTAKTGDLMPAAIQNIAYALLLVLMFGVVTGWLGAA